MAIAKYVKDPDAVLDYTNRLVQVASPATNSPTPTTETPERGRLRMATPLPSASHHARNSHQGRGITDGPA